jgi:acyl carrier protein
MNERSEPEIRNAIRRLIGERVDDVPLDDSASLLETTNLDSLGIITLLVAIEEQFNVNIDVLTIDPESLLSISGLTRHLSELVEFNRG